MRVMHPTRPGILLVIGAYVIWGLSPIYWKAIGEVPPGQQLAHRIVWSVVLLGVLLTLQRRWPEARDVLRSRRVGWMLLASTGLIASNWLTYLWSVATERILQASLGYFINPLVTVLLGVVFLGERLRRPQGVALALASVGVLILAVRLGTLPWISLVLAFTFGFYSLVRKEVQAGPEVGLFVETLLLSPWMLIYLLRAGAEGTGAFGRGELALDLLLVAAGAITAVPLLLFTHGARRLPLSTVGFLQYLAPSLQFLLAIAVYRERFTPTHLIAFLFIWTALAVFSWDTWRRGRKTSDRSATLRSEGAALE
jgi:chloramphenicol-sensitive protein RarD